MRVNVLSPGPIDTPGLSGLAPDAGAAKDMSAFMATQVPLGRLGHVDEVAAAALFLASDEASFVNGTEMFVDGGLAQV